MFILPRPRLDAAGDGTGGGTTPPPQNPPASDPPPQNDPPPPTTPPAPTGGDSPPAPTVESLQAELAKVRKEAAEARTKSRDEARAEAAQEATDALAAKLAAALGIKTKDEPPSTDELLAKIAEQDSTINGMKIDSALSSAMVAAGADAGTMLPYLRGTGEIATLKPDAKDFDESVTALVATTLEAHPNFKSGQAPPKKSGPDGIPPGGGEPGQLGQDDIENLSDEEFDQAVADGRFKALLGGKK